jgi:Domain of unknown function (DUF4214)
MMNRLSAESVRRRPLSPLRTRLHLEPLEERRVLAVTYHGGPLLQSVQVEPVFYGPYWNSALGQQQASDLDNFLSFLTNSSHMDMLNEYNVGRGVLVDHGIVAGAGSSTSSLDDTTIQQTLDSDIANGLLPPVNANRVYVVFTAPNVDVTQGGQDSKNNFFGYHAFFTGAAGEQIYYAVIAHPIGNGNFYNLNVFQTLTKVTSHELSEAVTDPGVGGWYDNRTGYEIGDIADGPQDVGLLNGYVIQAEWSARQQAVVLPAGAQWIDATVSLAAKSITDILDQTASVFTHSDEYFADLITADYVQLLHRTPTSPEVNQWIGLMKSGLTDEQSLAGFTSSPEYYQQAGGTDQAWLDALYHDVLSRAADAAGEATWLQSLASGVSRFNVAYAFATSVEHETMIVAEDYQRFLGRTATASEAAGWVTNLQQGMSDEQVVAAFVGSNEFYSVHASSITGWLNGAYQVVFERAPDTSGFNYWSAYLQNALAGG